ncbi:MAG: hypothetical protein AAGD86_06735 [Pseudomonadota bacterium]
MKLWQFDRADRNQFRKTMADELKPPASGVATALLHQDPRERVTYHELDAAATLALSDGGGIEALVLHGSLSEGGDALEEGSWLRLPPGAALRATAGSRGAKVWLKSGHLLHASALALP